MNPIPLPLLMRSADTDGRNSREERNAKNVQKPHSRERERRHTKTPKSMDELIIAIVVAIAAVFFLFDKLNGEEQKFAPEDLAVSRLMRQGVFRDFDVKA